MLDGGHAPMRNYTYRASAQIEIGVVYRPDFPVTRAQW